MAKKKKKYTRKTVLGTRSAGLSAAPTRMGTETAASKRLRERARVDAAMQAGLGRGTVTGGARGKPGKPGVPVKPEIPSQPGLFEGMSAQRRALLEALGKKKRR